MDVCVHPTISSVVLFFSCLQSFPASGAFPVCQLFTSGGQSLGAARWVCWPQSLSRFWICGCFPTLVPTSVEGTQLEISTPSCGWGLHAGASLCPPILHPSGGALSVTVTVTTFTDSGPEAQHASSPHPSLLPVFCT